MFQAKKTSWIYSQNVMN